MSFRSLSVFLLVLLALTGCASLSSGPHPAAGLPAPPSAAELARVREPVPRVEPLSHGAMKPYTALGRRYVPYTALRPYSATGLATWYRARDPRQTTAIGERYDMYGALTGAHPVLPLPSYVRVTNLENGRHVVVRLNDRGPFDGTGRHIIDLSYVAAWKLGFTDKGVARVRVDALLPGHPGVHRKPARERPVSRPAPAADEREPDGEEADAPAAEHAPAAAPPSPAPEPREAPASRAAPAAPRDDRPAWLSLGEFPNQSYALALSDRLRAEGVARPDQIAVVPAGGRFAVRVGPFPSREAARPVADRVAAGLGIRPALVGAAPAAAP